jgi:hypothetical protein
MHIPKVWISLGQAGEPLSPAAIVLVAYLGGLLVLGLAGAWMVRRDRRWWAMMLTIVLYWVFLIIAPEARRTLPLRLPMLLLAGVAAEHWLRGRMSAARGLEAVAS